MLSLFSLNPQQAGFRLHRVEVWNWGTFHEKVYSISPHGENSLLTGANGSGKTTFVHALLTLLAAEKRMRSFNQSAEGKTKNERTEESYVTGEFGTTEDAHTGTSKVQRLREDKSSLRSVLLAVFKNEDYFLTLIQVRWFVGNDLKRQFIIAHKELSIENDFQYFDPHGEWKKILKQRYPKQGHREAIEFFDGPKEYGNRLRNIFGMRSEKAQTLFNQTISLKILGNLDEFVRHQMLEETDMEEAFVKLKTHFSTLSEAHRNIEKTQHQIRLLQPVREAWNKLKDLDGHLFTLRKQKEILPAWFAIRQQQLLTKEIQQTKLQLQLTGERREEIESILQQHQEELFNLEGLLRSSDVGRRLQEIDQRIKELSGKKKEREERKSQFLLWVQKLGWELGNGEREFDKLQQKVQDRKQLLSAELEEKRRSLFSCEGRREQVALRMEELEQDIQLLQQQRNNITGKIVQIRQQILEQVGATEEEIPFVAELVQIIPGEEKWEFAIEKLLRSFALRLIVPDAYYKAVIKYVNQTNLQGRIVFERFVDQPFLKEFYPQSTDSVPGKIQVKDGSPYAGWVQEQLNRFYNYRCTDQMTEFAKMDYAITSSGMVKSGNRHEKDDRPEKNHRQQYVLGWDASSKIQALVREHGTLESQFQSLGKEAAVLKGRVMTMQEQERALVELSRINSYSLIHSEEMVTAIEAREKEKKKVEKGSGNVQEIKKQQEQVVELVQKSREKLEEKIREEEQIKYELAKREQELRMAAEVIQHYENIPIENELIGFQMEYIVPLSYEIDLDVWDKARKQVSSLLNKQMEEYTAQYNKIKQALQKAMWEFRNPSDEELLKKFQDWRGDTHRLSDQPEFAGEYIDLLERLEKEQLIEQKERFKKYLNEEMINRMSSFKEQLDEQLHEIVRNIDSLNKSLKLIQFRKNPDTYIQLEAKEDLSPQIKEFRTRLISWKPDLSTYYKTKDESILEQSYLLIKSLLDELDLKESWRKEVTDVRQWLRFTAREVLKSDQTNYRSYTGTEKLSGGEQAQLTYTILGSAIAYQFGISQDALDPRSFRFICVDEAFSRQDEDKARYLMDLCKQLNLQIMVVSPAKAEEVRIVEPYIARVHYVQRRGNRDSVLYDMPMMELAKMKKQTGDTASLV